MEQDPKPYRDLNANIEKAAQQTIKQAEGATENYLDFIQKTMSGSPLVANDFAKKLQSYTEQNIAATQAYVHALSQVKTVQDAVQLQMGFMQGQMTSFVEQMKGLGEAYSKAISGAVKSPFDRIS